MSELSAAPLRPGKTQESEKGIYYAREGCVS
ncbi:hypothetical protein TPASS_0161 [Treponema pallidum subsp. pallidum SS14]|uniref:Uncharacterized protein TP_0161 n=2 Tax=Treponema pallidum subsp. pallidum TaxID=161 RepID=Y161_TREPA|nr:RecName: Full=Uncharacterized protein TP_0161 [Treponema pallidum subsp. pallidum str. Nichols]AAC65153.1 predicted coding region TP0161 [Treponema pallidum subsp. pallidum str. Nichols]ACD70587.1 hypothetical protein TPASS_0161 [Treponema pallidum subsp. pallidum SS14]